MHSFDTAALSYDLEFSVSEIKKCYREGVWRLLQRSILSAEKPPYILEVNCGTGNDAVGLASLGCSVVATDISEAMIEEVRKKVAQERLEDRITALQLPIQELHTHPALRDGKEFDLVLSNFGGLNCLTELELSALENALVYLLKPGGRFIAVVMTRFCLWETFYYLIKGKKQEAYRRFSKRRVTVKIGSSEIPVYYYTPRYFKKLMRRNFTHWTIRPIGFFVPPPYLEYFFAHHPDVLRLLKKIENICADFPLLAYASDHFYIECVRR